MSGSTRNRMMLGIGAVACAMALAAGVMWPTGELLESGLVVGTRVELGEGFARTYVTMEEGRPVEVGVALSEGALRGLPAMGDPGGMPVHGHVTWEHVLPLPTPNPTPFRHVLLNWNPGGHEPPGIYSDPHMDFHFYTMENAERLAIVESDPAFQAKAVRSPAAAFLPAGYIMPDTLAVPRMGMHWIDPTSPEFNGERFSHTFIYGTWDGRLIFAEPMITKAVLESRRTFEKTIPVPERVERPGLYPAGYRVSWDAERGEHRVALIDLRERGSGEGDGPGG